MKKRRKVKRREEERKGREEKRREEEKKLMQDLGRELYLKHIDHRIILQITMGLQQF